MVKSYSKTNSKTIPYLKPFNFCVCSGHFTVKSNFLLLRNKDIHDGFGDHGRRFCTINACESNKDDMKRSKRTQ